MCICGALALELVCSQPYVVSTSVSSAAEPASGANFANIGSTVF